LRQIPGTGRKTLIEMAGDDLADDFVADELVALSGDEVDLADDVEEEGAHSPDEDEAQAGGQKDVAEKKRKRNAKEKERKAKVLFLYHLDGLGWCSSFSSSCLCFFIAFRLHIEYHNYLMLTRPDV
jgi:hypothetical protein